MLNPHSKLTDFELICMVVNFGMGNKVMQAAKQYGIKGGTILLGKGTIKNRILELLAISDVRKEIILMAADQDTARQALEQLDHKFKLSKPNHGIAFTTSISRIVGASSLNNDPTQQSGGVDPSMYQAITVIVDKGNAEYVMEAANEAGSKGGTIINGRGSGVHEGSKVLAMEIVPEKEIVLILSQRDSTDAIVSSIRSKL